MDKRRAEERRSEKRIRRKKMQVREKVGSRETLCFFNDLWPQKVEK